MADLGRAAEQATGSAAAAAERQRLEQAAADFRQAAEQRRSWLGRHRASAGLDRTPARVDQHARDRVRDLDRAG